MSLFMPAHRRAQPLQSTLKYAKAPEPLEELCPNRCGLDSLPLELLRKVISQVAPRSVSDTQRTLARLAMVNKQLNHVLRDDARGSVWISSPVNIKEPVAAAAGGAFTSARTLIATRKNTPELEVVHIYGTTQQRWSDDLRGPDLAAWCFQLPQLQSIYLHGLHVREMKKKDNLNAERAFPLDSPILARLTSVSIKDSAVTFNSADAPALAACQHLSLCDFVHWQECPQGTGPESLLCAEPNHLPQLKTLRLSPLFVTGKKDSPSHRLPSLPIELVQQLEAMQVDFGSAEFSHAIALPLATPLFQQEAELLGFEYVQIAETFLDTCGELCRILSASTKLRALFFDHTLLRRYPSWPKPLDQLLSDLKMKGIDVIASEPDAEECVLPEFLEYLDAQKRKSA